MVGICPNCEHPNFPFHQIASDVEYVDPNRPEQSVFCSYDGDCDCIRHLAKVIRIVNTEKEVSANAFRR